MHDLNGQAYTAFLARLRESFLKGTPQVLTAIRDQLSAVVRSERPAAARTQLAELSKIVRLLGDHARITNFDQIARMTNAFALFLDTLQDHPQSINSSTLRTTTHSVDFLRQLFEGVVRFKNLPSVPPLILVIDDEPSLTTLVCASLHQAALRTIALTDPADALKVMELNTFDLIFLDVSMPGMDGFEVCTRLRALPANAQTPVIFVTGLADFDNRAQAILRGGNDLIAKPFLPAELIVKALTYIYRSQLRALGEK
ncbi:MAG: response regulator [Verrucomicrobia bacterium]|nr:response regulator [Verrucomicrobiota bacterium]